MVLLLGLVSCLNNPGNHPPDIELIILNPTDNHTPGSDIAVSAIVTDRDGDPLQYFWQSQGGIIAEPENANTSWELAISAEPLSYESITLMVSDGKETTTRTETIQVSEGLIMSGYTYFAGTTIPVPGAEVTIGKFSTFSDQNGFYFIAHLKEGYTDVIVSKEGFDAYESMVYVDNPKSIYHIQLTSPLETREISGRVRTVDNRTFAGLSVVLLNPDGSESELSDFSDQDGSFRIASVPYGSRNLMIRNVNPESHFLYDSIIHPIELDDTDKTFDARIKIKRTIIADSYLSEMDKWDFGGSTPDGFYLIGRGQRLDLKEFIAVPADAENAMFYINSFIVGGCDLVGMLPSHRVWVSNYEGEYLGGISWGGEGNNFTAEVSWNPSELPTFLDIYGKQIKLHLELFDESNCIPNPLWRVYQIEFSYYH